MKSSTLTPEPSLAVDLKLKVEPSSTKLVTDKLLPSLAMERTESELPSETQLITDM
jgi:hypothetical protein